MKRPLIVTLLLALIVFPVFCAAASAEDAAFKVTRRSREKADDGSWKIVYKTVEYDPAKTAVIVCDVWDDHYCKNAAKRVGEMAPKLNAVLHLARDKGALIIHAPSGTMDVYKDTPQRKRALAAPAVETKIPLQGWVHLMKDKEPPMPVETTKTSCDDPQAGAGRSEILQAARGDRHLRAGCHRRRQGSILSAQTAWNRACDPGRRSRQYVHPGSPVRNSAIDAAKGWTSSSCGT